MILRALTSPLKQHHLIFPQPSTTLTSPPIPHRMDLNQLYTHQSTKPLSSTTTSSTNPMSNISLSTLQYLSRDTLASQFSPTGSLPSSTAIIDVRDSDHIGGHIRGSTWVPSNQLDYRVAELVRTLRDKQVVVFHCALSQQRGPGAALRYLRERERLDSSAGGGAVGASGGAAGKENDEVSGEDVVYQSQSQSQRVYVLRGGFTEWQEKYGADEKLTEGWVRDIWE